MLFTVSFFRVDWFHSFSVSICFSGTRKIYELEASVESNLGRLIGKKGIVVL